VLRPLLAVLVLGLVPAAPAAADVLWTADAARGLDAWDTLERVRDDRIAALPGTVPDGLARFRFELHEGEHPGQATPSSERVEARGPRVDGSLRRFRAGDDVFLGWQQRFASDFPSPAGPERWCQFLQFKEEPDRGSPLLAMTCSQGRLALQLGEEYRYRVPWSAPLVRGRWQSVVLRVRFSRRRGFVALWVDGRRVPLRWRGPTIRAGARPVLKMGVYRAAGVEGAAALEIASVRLATSRPEAAPLVTTGFGLRAGVLLPPS